MLASLGAENELREQTGSGLVDFGQIHAAYQLKLIKI